MGLFCRPCLDVEKVARSREKPSPVPAEQAFSSQWAGSTGCSGRAIMPRELELVRQFTWLQLWSIWPLRSWSLLAMLPGTTRNLASSQGIFSLLSGNWSLLRQFIAYLRNDEELNKLLAGVTIAQGGVLPNIQAVLLPRRQKRPKQQLRYIIIFLVNTGL